MSDLLVLFKSAPFSLLDCKVSPLSQNLFYCYLEGRKGRQSDQIQLSLWLISLYFSSFPRPAFRNQQVAWTQITDASLRSGLHQRFQAGDLELEQTINKHQKMPLLLTNGLFQREIACLKSPV